MEYQLIFSEPSKRLAYETKSKFLDEESDLYFFIKDMQDRLRYNGMRLTDKMEPCVRILEDKEFSNSEKSASFELFKRRVKSIHKTRVTIEDRSLYCVVGKQLHLNIPGEFEGKKYNIVIATLSTIAPNIGKFLNIMFEKIIDPSNYEDTGSSM